MKRMIQKEAKKRISRYRSNQKFRMISAALSVLVVMGTVGGLILPAQTLTRKTQVLDCQYATHTHTETCYDSEKHLVCGYADYVVHQHDDSCYQDGKLVCTLPEIPEHKHTDACYQEQQELTCGMEESAEHQHDANCYETVKELTCGQQELHTHTADCYDENGQLTCGLMQLEQHQHGNACFKTVEQEEPQAEQNEPAPAEAVTAQPEANTNERNAPAETPTASAPATAETPTASAPTQNTEQQETPAAVAMPAQQFDGSTDAVTVHAEAPEGALPEGTTMTVTKVTEKNVIDSVTDAVNGKVKAVEAVDITFRNASGQEIEPAKEIRVTMTSKQIAKAEESVVVHVDDEGKAEVVEQEEKQPAKNAVAFDTNAFSVYALAYTVDFEYEVDGKVYQFSLPGGGFVSFTDLVEVLGIIGDTNSDNSGDENAAESAKNTVENAVNKGVEESGVNSTTNTALTLGDVEVSDAARKFVSDVESVKFSNPELVSVSKVENDTTVGQIKENRGLECEYSADLTEEQIAEINAQTVEAGDWALISVHPFISKESLTVTMKNGDLFTIQVTDGQIHTYAISDSGDTYKITVTYDDATGIPADAELQVRQLTPDDERYQKDIERSNTALLAECDQEAANPVIFEIKIIANGKEIEPIEGTQVGVEISLAMDAINGKSQEEAGENAELEEKGCMLIDGLEYTVDPDEVDPTSARVVHLTDDDEAVVIEDLNSMVDVDNNMVLNFATESFSDYTISGVNNNYGLNGLPDTIYVGDEIYMQNCSDMWVTGIRSVVTETKYNNLDSYKSVRATSPGTFRICHKNDWNNGATGYTNQYAGKYITILPARSEGNNGQPYPGTTPPATIETIDNASIGLKLNLFDYDLDDYLDNRFNNKDYGSTEGGFVGHGINDGNALKFWGSGITDSSYGSHNNYVEHGVTSIVSNTLNSSGYPQVASNAGYSGGGGNKDLSYLFTPSDGTDKKAYPNADGLFKKDGDYYVYDSDQNYAWYNPDTNRFEVYNGTYKQKLRGDGGELAPRPSTKNIGFFPFHKWDDQQDLFVNWNKNLNHHFGMSMSVPFSLPKDPKAVKDSNGNPIVFEFSGDDDMWVFIDGKLAMDIGGIHQPTSGTINFTEQKVTVNGQSQSFDFSKLYDGKKHTLQVFYIERGGCDSNCKIMFNMTQYGDVEFDKVDAEDNTLLAGAVFGLYKNAACTQPLTEELKNGKTRAFIVETDANGHAKLEDVPLGDYYLKEIHAPDGYPIAIGDDTVRVRVYLDADGNVKTSVGGQESNAKILNSKPSPINLGLNKEWQNADGQTITAPDGVTATFEIKRMRTYETYTEREVRGEEEKSSHLTVGWIHNGETHVYEEFDLVAGSQATVSWSLANGYTGTIGCEVNGTRYTKSPSTNNIYSQGFTMPAAGQTATLYIIDESENGDAIKNINVAGSQFYGNSGGGFIHEFHTITEPDPGFTYTGTNATNNQVTLPINESTWQYVFSQLPSLGTGTVTVDGKQQKVTYKYSYYIEEVSSTAPEGTTVIYKDTHDNVISSPTDAETHTSGTQAIINRVAEQEVVLKKVGVNNTDQTQTQSLLGGAKFTIYKAAGENKDQKGDVVKAASGQMLENLVSDNATGIFWSGKLFAGDYIIEEVEAPDGYNKVGVLIKMTVSKDGVSLGYVGTVGTPPYNQPVKEGNTWAITIINIAGVTLPNTGGVGTNIFYILGAILTLGAGVLLIKKRRIA